MNDNKRRKNTKTRRTNRSKDSRRSNEVKDKRPEYELEDKAGRTDNDVSWYAPSDQLLRDACSISFADSLGLPVKGLKLGNQKPDDKLPGIMSLQYLPYIGSNGSAVSPINQAALALYSFVNYGNSRNTKYDPSDMMMYILGMDSAYSFHAWMMRIYGVSKLYSQLNRYYPITLLQSLGVDASIISNLADFRAYINSYAWKLGSFFVPNSIPYINRHVWLNTNVFKDTPNVKSQTYVFSQRAFHVWNSTGKVETPGSACSIEYLPDTLMKFSDIVNFGDKIINNLLASQDIGIMGSDIKMAFGENQLIQMGTMSEDYVVVPIYNPEVMPQIHNATALGEPISGESSRGDIYQKDGIIYQDIAFEATAQAGGSTKYRNYYVDSKVNDHVFLDSPYESPNPGDVMIMTRLHSRLKFDGSDALQVDTAGSELVTKFVIYNSINPENGTSIPLGFASSNIWVGQATQPYTEILENASLASRVNAFNMHPLIMCAGTTSENYTTTDGSVTPEVTFFELNNYTATSVADLYVINDIAMQGLFAVPQFGTFYPRNVK